MMLLNEYYCALLGFFAYLILLFIQWLISSIVKAIQLGAIPGKIDSSLSHSSFVFRSHRAFHNTLENSPLIMGAFILAIFLRIHEFWLALFIWAYFGARVVHMLCYYFIATEKNNTIRSWFFIALAL